jgi:hypothetical protein
MGICLMLMKVKEYRAKRRKEERRKREIHLN